MNQKRIAIIPGDGIGVEVTAQALRVLEALALPVATWMRYVTGRDEKGGRIDVRDPLADEFARIATRHGDDPEALAGALLDIGAIFGADLPRDARFAGPVKAWFARLMRNGVRATLAA